MVPTTIARSADNSIDLFITRSSEANSSVPRRYGMLLTVIDVKESRDKNI